MLIYTVMFCLCPKPAALYLWIAFSFMNFVTANLKAVYAEPRPYWVSNQISSSGCLKDFGNPSGHMTSNTFIYTSLYLHCYYEVGVKRQKMNVFCTAYIIKMGLTAVMCIYFMFLALSRVYLGAHSYN
mmetsp:Transcript_8964/g.6308  ORF Transcript_8964/g.6308 Transcript_8964/m.6308 type:complete len:128 (+) Transcript_8964:215-598(+)